MIEPAPADFISLLEVSPRDGLQAETAILPSAVKVAFIDLLSQSGLSRIEVTSFSDPRRIVQLADAEQVYRTIKHCDTVTYLALVPNRTGLKRALEAGVTAISVLSSASDAFSLANIGCDSEAALTNIGVLVTEAQSRSIPVRAYVSCAYACPFSGVTDPDRVANIAVRLVEMGCTEVALADTTGTGTPMATRRLLQTVATYLPLTRVAVHLHDAHGSALENALAAVEAGVRTVDTAVNGLGGCPAAGSPGGNLATERLCLALDHLGYRTGIDLDALQKASRYLETELLAHRRSLKADT